MQNHQHDQFKNCLESVPLERRGEQDSFRFIFHRADVGADSAQVEERPLWFRKDIGNF